MILGIIIGILISIISITIGVVLSKQTKFRQIVNKVEQSSKPKGLIIEKETKEDKVIKGVNILNQ